MGFILHPDDAVEIERHGGKAAALGQLAAANLPVPAWIAVDPRAFYQSVGQASLATAGKSSDFDKLFDSLQLDAGFTAELERALADLVDDDERLAVRSSAVDEDSAEHSFAGQLESYLYVPTSEVAVRVIDVWRSGFSERVLTYRAEAGLDALPPVPAVLVQRMVESDRAGVAFAADPVSGDRQSAVVSAVHGLGTSLVSGDADADTWRVDRQGTIGARDIGTKLIAHRFDPGSTDYLRAESLQGADSTRPVLADAEVIRIAGLVRAASDFFGKPQDIEWALEDGNLWLLQSRPITTLATLADTTGERNLWDNSNIAESYGGITTPLTFSFARRAYESVYREFCRILRVSDTRIEDNDATFKRMLGLVRGRVYYNLLSWYRVLALLPGFTVNRQFMEQMMGVKEGLPEDIVRELEADSAGRLRDALRLAASIAGLLSNHFLLARKIDRFYRRLARALNTDIDLSAMNATDLTAHYRELERRLLTHWDAPLINDFFAMIFYGLLRGLAGKWCNDSEQSLQNDLLAGEGGMISAEPAQRVREMAQMVAADEAMTTLLIDGELTEIVAAIDAHTGLREAYRAYLEKFGDRCLDELKLESATLHDDPLLLLRSIGQFARRLATQDSPPGGSVEQEIRSRAEARVADALDRHALRRRIFDWVLKHTRARVRDRENLRFERTRLFGRVRRIFIELGKRLFAEGSLDNARDVFYLEVDEVLGYVAGTTVTTDLRGLVALRRREFDGYRSMEPPADRFETFGAVHEGNRFEAPADSTAPADGDLSGIGCCPGIVRGAVRVISDPRNATLKAGEILVAERTDPGWIMLFPVAAGILVERGSLLSHSAIVSREMGIPSIVAVEGITRTLKDGDWIEFDGSSGIIRRVEAPAEACDDK